jgi:hypothetical protein
VQEKSEQLLINENSRRESNLSKVKEVLNEKEKWYKRLWNNILILFLGKKIRTTDVFLLFKYRGSYTLMVVLIRMKLSFQT